MLEYITHLRVPDEFPARAARRSGCPSPAGGATTAAGWSCRPTADERSVVAARAELDVPGVAVEPRAQWPSAMSSLGVQLSGRIPVGEKAETGRAVGRLDGIGWGSALRDLLDPDAADGEVPVPLRHAVVQVLDGWLPAGGERASGRSTDDGQLDAVVFIESERRPMLVRHLATGLARYRSLPVATSFEVDRSPAADRRDQLRPPVGVGAWPAPAGRSSSRRRQANPVGRRRHRHRVDADGRRPGVASSGGAGGVPAGIGGSLRQGESARSAHFRGPFKSVIVIVSAKRHCRCAVLY